MNWFYFALISALFSAAAAIFEKKVLFQEKALEFSLVLALFNLVLSIPILLSLNLSALSGTALWVLFGKTILGMLSFLCVMYGLKNLEISGALPLLVLTPGLVALTAFIFLKEALGRYEVLGLILLLVGTYILQLLHKRDLLEPFKIFVKSKGHRYIVVALILFTVTSILDKVLLKEYNLPPLAFLGFQHLFLAIDFLLLALLWRKKELSIVPTLKRSWLPILLVAIFTMIYRYTQIEAVKLGSVALVLALKRTSVFFAVVIGGQLFHDHYLLRKTIATVIMLAGAILVIVM
ncbi:MAG TPA: EamA family transporter [Candidatus Cloacimonadota bacterium]|nr:EamA family transporter [Candidatus Cloacimonadota bacterium]